MKLQSAALAGLLLVSALSLGGCQKNIVKAAPPSVSTPPETVPPPATPPPHPQTTSATESEPKPEPPPATPPATKPAPVRPKPAPSSEPAPVAPLEPKPEAPEIAPQLTPQQQTADEQRTANDIQAAEKNLQLASGRQLNASQEDLVEKVRDFLGQAHEAVRAGDWVRASNLAHKARILSDDLVKSL
jgi:outer membrane biosynthesis protein TonB